MIRNYFRNQVSFISLSRFAMVLLHLMFLITFLLLIGPDLLHNDLLLLFLLLLVVVLIGKKSVGRDLLIWNEPIWIFSHSLVQIIRLLLILRLYCQQFVGPLRGDILRYGFIGNNFKVIYELRCVGGQVSIFKLFFTPQVLALRIKFVCKSLIHRTSIHSSLVLSLVNIRKSFLW